MSSITLQYALSPEDFLVHQLYQASTSKRLKNKRLRTRTIVPIIYVILALLTYSRKDSNLFTILLLVVGLLWFLFYPIRSKKRYIKHYKNHIKDNYANRVNKVFELECNENFIFAKNDVSESKIKTSEVESLIELKNHFLIQLKNNTAFIIPKNIIENINAFKDKLSKNLNVPIVNQLNWKFK